MANPDHLARLRSGVEEWNTWMKKFRTSRSLRVDFIEADLRGVRLGEADLRGANFAGANLAGAVLTAADLSEAFLRGANLRKANLNAASLSDAWLVQADLTEANLHAADLKAANLRKADLTGANLSYVNLTGADLSEANLNNADFRDVIYTESTRWPDGFQPPVNKRGDAGTFSLLEPEGVRALQKPGEFNEVVPYDFSIRFHPELSPEQIKLALEALADFYRSCGGVGFKIDPEFQTVVTGEPEYAGH